MKLKIYNNNWVEFNSTAWFKLLQYGQITDFVYFKNYNINSIYTYKR